MENKKITLGIIGITILIVFLSQSLIFGHSVQEKSDTIKIGVITPLTGFTAESGQNVKKGLELGREYVEQRDGVKIEFVYEDGQCLGTESLNAYNKLNLDEDIQVITGFVCSSEVLPIAHLLEDKYLIPTTSSSPLISDASENIFRVAPNDKEDAMIHHNYIKDHYNKEDTIGVVYINNDYGVAIKDILVSELEKSGYDTEIEAFNFGTGDFKSILTKLKSKDVKVISFIGYPENSMIFLKEVKELNMDVQILGSWATLSDEFFKIENQDLLENYLVTYFGESSSEFESLYRKKYNEDPVVYSDFAFDSVLVISELVKNNDVSANSFSEINIEKGATGSISFDSKGDRKGLETSLYKIIDQELVKSYRG